MNQCKRLSDCPADRLAQCRGEAVPPAGDVEVLGRALRAAFGIAYCGEDSDEMAATALQIFSAHVTHLTCEVDRLNAELCARAGQIGTLAGERDGLLAEVERLREECHQNMQVAASRLLESKFAQSELTKARELLAQEEDENTVLRGALKDVLDWIDCSQSSAALRSIAQNALDYSATPIAHNVDESCGQDAEAAKVNSVTSTIDPYIAPAAKGESDE